VIRLGLRKQKKKDRKKDSWSISNPTGHPVRSQALSEIHPQAHWSPCAFTGMHLQSHWDLYAFTGMHPQTTLQSRCPLNLPPPSRVLFLYFISYKKQHGSACVLARCGVQSSRIVVALWPTCVVLSRYVSSPVAFDWLLLRRARVVFPHPGSSWFWEARKRHSYRSPPRDLGVRGASIVRMWTLVFGWPQLGLISPVRFPSWSRYILGSGVELN